MALSCPHSEQRTVTSLYAFRPEACQQVIELALQHDFVALADRQFILKSLDENLEATNPDLERKRVRVITGLTVKQSCSRFATLSQRTLRVRPDCLMFLLNKRSDALSRVPSVGLTI